MEKTVRSDRFNRNDAEDFSEAWRHGRVITRVGFLAFNMAAVAISQSSSLSLDSSKATNAAASIFAIIDRESKIDPSDTSRRVLNCVKGDIELCHTRF
ncbi:hypothetical protein Bca4012_061358 [Brassica carinata]